MSSFSKAFWISIVVLLFVPTSANASEPITLHSDGWILKGDRYDATGDAPKAVALLFHNAGKDRTHYKRFATKLADQGITSFAIDLRGHGESTNLDVFDWKVRKNFEINIEAWRDIVALMQLVKADPALADLPLVFVGASYSGEKMAEAARNHALPDLMVEFSPGSFSDASIAMIDPSDIPWLFIRAEKELPFFAPLFEAIRAGSKRAEIWLLPGEGHGMHVLHDRPDLEERLIQWITEKLNLDTN